MKAVCSKHVQAYEVEVGCPWCEIPGEVPRAERPVATGPISEHAVSSNGAFCSRAEPQTSLLPSQGFDSRKLTVDDMTRLSRFYAL